MRDERAAENADRRARRSAGRDQPAAVQQHPGAGNRMQLAASTRERQSCTAPANSDGSRPMANLRIGAPPIVSELSEG